MKEFVDKLIESFLGECVIYAENYEKALNIANELTEEYINTSTDTSTNSLDASTNTSTTNADRIRSMTDEELAEFLINFKNTFGEEYEGEMSCLDWLQSE